jgi:hypothetical protein
LDNRTEECPDGWIWFHFPAKAFKKQLIQFIQDKRAKPVDAKEVTELLKTHEYVTLFKSDTADVEKRKNITVLMVKGMDPFGSIDLIYSYKSI